MNRPVYKPGARHGLRVAVVTETYPPEINGVARTVGLMVDALCERGHEVQLVRPRQREERTSTLSRGLRERLVRGFPIPFYRHLQIGIAPPRALLTEWMGVAAGCRAGRYRRAPRLGGSEYRKAPGDSTLLGFPHELPQLQPALWPRVLASIVSRYLRALHNRTDCTLVPTVEMQAGLEGLGFERVRVVGRGVDSFLSAPPAAASGCARPGVAAATRRLRSMSGA